MVAGEAQPLLVDTGVPAVSSAFFYLVGAVNDCPDGQGPLGVATDGSLRTASACN
jgi:hypothetical protein